MSHYKRGRIQKNIIRLPERGLLSTGSSWQRSWRVAARGRVRVGSILVSSIPPVLSRPQALLAAQAGLVALFWGGSDGPQHPGVSTMQGWRSASPSCGAGTGGKRGVLAKFVRVIAGRAGRLLL